MQVPGFLVFMHTIFAGGVLDLKSREKHVFLTSFNKENRVKKFQIVPPDKETKAEFLLLINRNAYSARLVTSRVICLANPGEWFLHIQEESITIAFPSGRVLDSQNRIFVTELLSARPVRLAIPFGYPMSVSSPGAHPRYYLRLPRACSMTFEIA